MNETYRNAYLRLALAAMAREHSPEFSYGDKGHRTQSGEASSRKARAGNDHAKLRTRKQRMKDAMRRAALGE